MKRGLWSGVVVAGALVLSVGTAVAADQKRGQQQVTTETEEQDQIYGSQMMTEQERAEYRAKMHAAETLEERERIRNEHHEQMNARAKERGMAMPDEPPMGGGMGMGPGSGMGMGPDGGRP